MKLTSKIGKMFLHIPKSQILEVIQNGCLRSYHSPNCFYPLDDEGYASAEVESITCEFTNPQETWFVYDRLFCYHAKYGCDGPSKDDKYVIFCMSGGNTHTNLEDFHFSFVLTIPVEELENLPDTINLESE